MNKRQSGAEGRRIRAEAETRGIFETSVDFKQAGLVDSSETEGPSILDKMHSLNDPCSQRFLRSLARVKVFFMSMSGPLDCCL